jgi:putative transposase
MPRVARIVAPGVAHHVTQRGNNRQDVFFVDDDRRVYLSLLAQRSAACGLQVLGYCLMSNHVHLVVLPRTETALAQAIGRTHFLYTRYINHLHRRSGHLWQNRFYSHAAQDPYLGAVMAYVERNPVRARLVRLAWRYPWSSAAAHLGGPDPNGLLDVAAWREAWTSKAWQRMLTRPEDGEQLVRIRRSVHTGRPLATDGFLSRLERRLGRRVRAVPVGRPRKPAPPSRRAHSRSPRGK